MKTMLVYDTETTGLPNWKIPSEDPSQPHITQIAAQLCDEESGDVLAGLNVMIRPAGWTIPEDLEKLTGITTEKATRYGVPLNSALASFIELWEMADFRVGHNESFDARMLRIELHRDDLGDETLNDRWKAGKAFCTANASTKILNLPPHGQNARRRLQQAEAAQPLRGLPTLHRAGPVRSPQRCRRSGRLQGRLFRHPHPQRSRLI